jgi:hypothetical protein
MKTINTKHQLLLRGSKRYRTLYAYLNKVPATGSLKLKIQSLNRLISFKMNNDYFLDNDASIVVPEGTPLYLINPTKNSGFGSTTITAPSSLTIKLGT